MQWGREWCTLMTCVVAEFDYMADILIHTGQSILGIPATVGINSPVSSSSRIFSSCDNKVAALIETETIRLKDMLTCLSSRWVQPYIALIVFILFLVFSKKKQKTNLYTLTYYITFKSFFLILKIFSLSCQLYSKFLMFQLKFVF